MYLEHGCAWPFALPCLPRQSRSVYEAPVLVGLPCKPLSNLKTSLIPKNSTSAQILVEYKPNATRSKYVDFCIVFCPDKEEEKAIEAVASDKPVCSINHSDLGSLATSPIAVSIETKTSSSNMKEGLVQLATWQSAHWRALRPYEDDDQQVPRLIEFLPSIITHGHDWYFTATVQVDGRARLYHKLNIGSTEDVVGIYRLLNSLQHLRQWLKNEYWPAYRAEVLGLPGVTNTEVD